MRNSNTHSCHTDNQCKIQMCEEKIYFPKLDTLISLISFSNNAIKLAYKLETNSYNINQTNNSIL